MATQTALFLRESSRGNGPPEKYMPVFTPIVGVSLVGEPKHPKVVNISMLVIPANDKWIKKYPGMPVAKPGQRLYTKTELNVISRNMFGLTKSKIAEQVAFLLQEDNLREIERNNTLVQAEENRKMVASRGGIY